MKYTRVIDHFGGLTKTAQALGLQRQTVHVWGVRKRIPSRWQLKLEILSDGALKADAEARKEAIELTSYVRACPQ
jgi:hypothetical protein